MYVYQVQRSTKPCSPIYKGHLQNNHECIQMLLIFHIKFQSIPRVKGFNFRSKRVVVNQN